MNSHLKLAFKVLSRRKFFTFISLFGISLTLVVLIVATAVLDNFLSPDGPESRFGRVLSIYTFGEYGPQDSETTNLGYGFIQRYVRTLPGIERSAAFTNPQTITIYQGASRIDVDLKRTDADYWRILEFHFLEGRPFSADEDARGSRVAVITDRTRDRLFGSGSAIGKTFELDGDRFSVIGVVPRVSLTRFAAHADMWAPIGTMKSSTYRHELRGPFAAMVLARSSDDLPRLKREFATRMKHFPLSNPKIFREARAGLDTTFEAAARVLTWNRMGDRAPMVIRTIFTAIAVLFMALPALNLVTLNLSRILERSSEIGVRKAFGAPRRALISQFVFENVILTLIGGVVAFVLATIALAVLTRSEVIPNAEFVMNVRIFGWGMLIALMFGLFSGVYPAWRMSRLDPVNALRGGVR